MKNIPERKIYNSLGLKVLQNNGCIACHSIDGSKIVGPSFKGLYGTQRTVTINGSQANVIADDNYIKSSIYEPDAAIVDGYSNGLMKSYKNLISEEDIIQINEYLKGLK